MTRLTPEEQRALEVAKCAQAAILDTAAMCGRAGLIGTAIQEGLREALRAINHVIATIEEAN